MAASRKETEEKIKFQKKRAVGIRKASLVQREVSAEQADGGIGPMRFRHEQCWRLWNDKTIPQSKIKDFCQPPLHKGAFTQLADRTYALTRYARNRGLCPHMKNPRFYRGVPFSA